jgi:hypothetical protein
MRSAVDPCKEPVLLERLRGPGQLGHSREFERPKTNGIAGKEQSVLGGDSNVGGPAEKPDLGSFLITWSNVSDPEVCEQALEFWSDIALAFGTAPSRPRVTPSRPPSYPRR